MEDYTLEALCSKECVKVGTDLPTLVIRLLQALEVHLLV